MPEPSLFPKFMNPLGGAGGDGEGIVVELMAEPDIVVSDQPISVTVESDTVIVDPDAEIVIEVEEDD